MVADYYPLSDVLAVASVHPFYSDTTYPPTREELPSVLANARESTNGLELSKFPLTEKDKLYKQIARLTNDKDPRNGYRQGTYISTTGGGSGGQPMVFATDSIENRQQRAVFGSLLRACDILGPGDWMLTMHVCGYLYRALDLMTEVFEASGATVLCAGGDMELEKIVKCLIEYRVNAIAGDAGQLVQLVRYITTLPEEKKQMIQIDKALYTSEPMTPAQRSFLKSVFPSIALTSVIGSAEAGTWGASTAELTESAMEKNYADFIFDNRLMHLEVLPTSIINNTENLASQPQPIPDGEKGLLVQTSLQRLRNPLVRYVCGDLASLHPLPESISSRLSPEDAAHYRIARVYGRDRQISFDWYGEYYEFQQAQAVMQTESWGILQYQIIRRYPDNDTSHLEVVLEVRVLRDSGPGKLDEEKLTHAIRTFFKWLFAEYDGEEGDEFCRFDWAEIMQRRSTSSALAGHHLR
ncbi:hypothetical protein MW887_007643 [Aspergillus wentii]|nr:hypothetical protein MW887_007643 [Aspergillus wentii]